MAGENRSRSPRLTMKPSLMNRIIPPQQLPSSRPQRSSAPEPLEHQASSRSDDRAPKFGQMCCCRAAQVAALNPDTEYECIGHVMQMRADLPLTVRRHCQLGRAAHAWSLGPLGPVVTAMNFARAAEASVVVSAPRMGVHSEYGFCLDVALPGALGRGEVLMYAPRRWSRRPPHPTALYVAAGLIGLICLYWQPRLRPRIQSSVASLRSQHYSQSCSQSGAGCMTQNAAGTPDRVRRPQFTHRWRSERSWNPADRPRPNDRTWRWAIDSGNRRGLGCSGPWILAVVDASPGGGGNDPGAAPDEYRATHGAGAVLLTLDVDGEQFAIRQREGGGYHYDWVSGPNQGYGFSSSGTPSRPVEEYGSTSAGSSP
jgi:hypothetical protein